MNLSRHSALALRRALVLVLACAAALLALAAVRPVRAAAATPVPGTPARLPAAIEPLAPYVEQTACSPATKHGTSLLAALLRRTYSGTSTATVYACGTDGTRSEHYDGRAIDWMVSVRNSTQRAEATAFISWLLATDARGNKFAMARRLGVMYLIWDNRMWGAWDGKWEEYNGCASLPSAADDNACHRTHVHVSLSWNGANGRTTFWSGRVAATDFGPCRPADLNWARDYGTVNTRGCTDYPAVRAPSGASATKRALVLYSGVAVRENWSGPAVSAVQSALHVSATGSFGTLTRTKVIAFQALHGLATSGVLNAGTWRALLAATK
jgi:peptidoglycan hydrolase-like protein with peptidoglycan-binding domain